MSWKYRSDEVDTTVSGGTDYGVGLRPSPRCFHTGSAPAIISTDGVNAAVGATTELYVCELYAPCTTLVTGIAHFNGSNVTDTIKIGLFDRTGNLLRATAATQQSGGDAYQLIPFATGPTGAAATTIALPGPGTYYVVESFSGTTSTLQTFGTGSFGAGKITGAVNSTAFISTSLTITPPTTFTTLLGTMNSLY